MDTRVTAATSRTEAKARQSRESFGSLQLEISLTYSPTPSGYRESDTIKLRRV